MNKEELLEMINSTINENGAGMITGKALNLALTEIVNAMGSGAGGEKLYMVMEEAQPSNVAPATAGPSYEIPSFCVEHNKEVYNKLKTVWNNGEELEGIFYVDFTHFFRHIGTINTNEYALFIPVDWGMDNYGNPWFECLFDGNISMEYLWSDGYFRQYKETGDVE